MPSAIVEKVVIGMKIYPLDILKCPICRRLFRNKDLVVVDVINTMIHVTCVRYTLYELKDIGTYEAMKKIYLIHDHPDDIRYRDD